MLEPARSPKRLLGKIISETRAKLKKLLFTISWMFSIGDLGPAIRVC
jgi:hypothetical protein